MLPVARTNGSSSAGRLNGLFEHFFGDSFVPTAAHPARTALPLAAWEDADAVTVEVDLPGVTAGDIDVSVHGRVLTIKGERKADARETGFDTRPHGAFEQRVGLPAPVDADRVQATFTNGVLKLTLPKSEAAKPRKIEVKA